MSKADRELADVPGSLQPSPPSVRSSPIGRLAAGVIGGWVGGILWLSIRHGRPTKCHAGWLVLGGAALGLLLLWIVPRILKDGREPPRRRPAPAWNGPFWVLLLLLFAFSELIMLNDFVATNYFHEDQTVAVQFVVVDAQTKAPVPGARVRLKLEGAPRSHEGRTAPDGTLRLELLCPGSSRVGWFTTTSWVYYYGWQLQVSKDEYIDVGPTGLEEYLGAGKFDDDLPPPAITVELHRKARARE